MTTEFEFEFNDHSYRSENRIICKILFDTKDSKVPFDIKQCSIIFVLP